VIRRGRRDNEVEDPDTRAVWDANAPVWIELSRAGFDVYRDLVNTPAFMEMLPDVEGQRGLDLGCGEGHNTRLVAQRGADVTALDVSRPFVSAAVDHERSDPLEIRYVLGDARSLPFASARLDFVTAFMSLMDLANPEGVLVEIARVLRPRGFLQFSIGHPFTTTPIRRWVESDAGEREALAIGDYFYEGPLEETWIFGAAPEELRQQRRPFRIVYARRTLAGWLNAVISAGFAIEAVAEPRAAEQTVVRHPEVADTRIAPYFLLVRARRFDHEGRTRSA
jgi:SAM-dependent methyltransferase